MNKEEIYERLKGSYDKLYPKPTPIIYEIFAVNNGSKFISCNGKLIIQGVSKGLPPESGFYDHTHTIMIKMNRQVVNDYEYTCFRSFGTSNYIIIKRDWASNSKFMPIGDVYFKQDKNNSDVIIIEIINGLSNRKQIFLVKKTNITNK